MSAFEKSRYSLELKHHMKEIFITYLWDMFHENDSIINDSTIYVRNAVWHYRRLCFRNRQVFIG